jgi:gentisate 1,2-dioxygenase
MTITHVLWAMFGVLPVNAVQAPHRHQSVAVDLVVDAKPGCYTMVGQSLGPDGAIKDGERFDWEPHAVFVTPPGLWHSHHNESGHPAHILPIQDAGLHTHLRTLDIRFTRQLAGGACEVVENAG